MKLNLMSNFKRLMGNTIITHKTLVNVKNTILLQSNEHLVTFMWT